MKRFGLIFALLLALGLWAVNNFLPDGGEGLKQRLKTAAVGELEYIRMIEALGTELAQGIHGDDVQQAVDIADNASLELARRQWQEALKPRETAAGTSENDGELQAMVSAFIARQLEYNGQKIPQNVRLDMPELPFDYICPLEGQDSSGFGYREHPIENIVKFHYGTDFAANGGTAVCAFADGVVTAAAWDDSYGSYVIISHPGEGETLYAHLSGMAVTEGTQVSRGQLIGQVGATGLATGPHLHFELKLNGEYLNPEYYL